MKHNAIGTFLCIALLWPTAGAAQDVAVKSDYPERYVVQPGDTLWDISGRFLNEPWRWTEIWRANPQIENPHLIYPGDEVSLTWQDGEPIITVRRRGRSGAHPTIKLSPRVRVSDLDRAIPTIPVKRIHQFLRRPRIVSEGELEEAAYIVSVGKEKLLASPGSPIYARGLGDSDETEFIIYRRGDPYVDPASGDEILGYEAIQVGTVALDTRGDPARLLVTSVRREVLVGDRLLPAREEEVDTAFLPRPPDRQVSGEIISVVDGVTQIGQHQVVVLNLGRRDGIEKGHVMAVYRRGATVVDEYARPPGGLVYPAEEADIQLDPEKQGGVEGFARAATDVVIAIHEKMRAGMEVIDPSPAKWQEVTLPDERAGTLMVFRPFERLSYALVMEATRAMHVNDSVRNP